MLCKNSSPSDSKRRILIQKLVICNVFLTWGVRGTRRISRFWAFWSSVKYLLKNVITFTQYTVQTVRTNLLTTDKFKTLFRSFHKLGKLGILFYPANRFFHFSVTGLKLKFKYGQIMSIYMVSSLFAFTLLLYVMTYFHYCLFTVFNHIITFHVLKDY